MTNLWNILNINGIDIDKYLGGEYYSSYESSDTEKSFMYNITGTISGLTETLTKNLNLTGNFEFINNSLSFNPNINNMIINNKLFASNTILLTSDTNYNNISITCEMFNNNNISINHYNKFLDINCNNMYFNTINNFNIDITANDISCLQISNNRQKTFDYNMFINNIKCINYNISYSDYNASNLKQFININQLNISAWYMDFNNEGILSQTEFIASQYCNIGNIDHLNMNVNRIANVMLYNIGYLNISAENIYNFYINSINNCNINNYEVNVIAYSSTITNAFNQAVITCYSVNNLNIFDSYIDRYLFYSIVNLNINGLKMYIRDTYTYMFYTFYNHNWFQNITNCNISLKELRLGTSDMNSFTSLDGTSTKINYTALTSNTNNLLFNYAVFSNVNNLNIHADSMGGGLILYNCNNITLNIINPFTMTGTNSVMLSLIIVGANLVNLNIKNTNGFTFKYIDDYI